MTSAVFLFAAGMRYSHLPDVGEPRHRCCEFGGDIFPLKRLLTRNPVGFGFRSFGQIACAYRLSECASLILARGILRERR